MAKLYLKFGASTLKEIPLTQATATIGRQPDNTVQIDNPAVSGHHAKITWNQDHYVVEDLGSLNGTFVNNARVEKTKLRHCDLMKIGKHEIEFKNEGPAPVAAIAAKAGPATPKLDNTVMLDTKQAQELLAKNAAPAVMSASGVPIKEHIGILSVLEGKTDQQRYVLTGKMTMIGKSQMASIHLKGWFAPNSAALISRRDNKYFIAPAETKVKLKVNGEDLHAQRELAAGDVIEVGKLKAAFSFQE
jgi:pSer/pThr/pTyr-binding forkhead associated (FHA) protein